MRIQIGRDLSPIKAGWAAHSVFHMTAHGRTPELAQANLEHAITMFLSISQREGNNILDASPLPVYDSGWWYQPVYGGLMERVNTFNLYLLGNVLKVLENFPQDALLRHVVGTLYNARMWLNWILADQMLPLTYCRPAGEALLGAIEQILEVALTPDGVPETPVGADKVYAVVTAYQAFEHTLAAELQQHDTYLVRQKGIYSTNQLIEHAENLFSANVQESLPAEAIRDISEAGRCLAFDVPTAAAFHILRAVEAVIRQYMAALNVKPLKESQRNWGQYIAKLRDAGGDGKVLAALEQIKDLHRNPTLHPEEFLVSDEALALLGVAQSAILGMVADIERQTRATNREEIDSVSVSTEASEEEPSE